MLKPKKKKYKVTGIPKEADKTPSMGGKKSRIQKGYYDPENEASYMLETPDVRVYDPSLWGKYGRMYDESHDKQAYIDRKKRQYLALHPILNRKAGLSMDYFPEKVEQNFAGNYDYDKNTQLVKDVAREEGWNPWKRESYVDDLTKQGQRIVANSRFGNKLQADYWARTLAGLQELGNFFIKQLPGEQGDVLKYKIPGLTKKERKDIADSSTGALESFSFTDIPGAVIANYLKNTGLSTGSDYKELPSWYSGQKMSNVTDLDATLANPFTWTGLADLPQLAVSLGKGAINLGKTGNNILKNYNYANDLKNFRLSDEALDLFRAENSNNNAAQELRRFTGQQPLELSAGKPKFFNSEYSELYDDLQRQIDNQKNTSNEIANFNPIDKINKSKVDSETFKRLIMGDDLKFKFDDYPDTPRISGQFQGLEIGRPGSLNSAPELLPKGNMDSRDPLSQLAELFRFKRSKRELSALDDLDAIRLQSKTGQENAKQLFNAELEQKIKNLNTPEGRRRVQKHIEDNNLVIEEDSPDNFSELFEEYKTELPRILSNKYSDESQRIIELVRNKMAARKKSPSLAGLKSWNELEVEHILNNPLLELQAYETIIQADPRYKPSVMVKRPYTHDDYVNQIKNLSYEDVTKDIDFITAEIKQFEDNIKNLSVEKNELNRFLKSEELDQGSKDLVEKLIKARNSDILKIQNKVTAKNKEVEALYDELNRSNASYKPPTADDPSSKISLGEPYTAIGEMIPAMTHELGHGTEMLGLKGYTSSAIDRALNQNLTFRKKPPRYLYKKFDLDKARQTSPSDIRWKGVDKYRNPEGYFKSNLFYFQKGSVYGTGSSPEPTAFAVEMRPALKELGFIKDDYDIVTPEIIKKLYNEYISNPKFQFRDIRILDLIEPTKENFKVLAENYNNIKSLLPYIIGTGAAGAAFGQGEEIQQDMNRYGGSIDKLNKFIR